MRAFIAVDLNDSLRRALAEVRDTFPLRDRCIRWVAPGSIHLTLKFLGEIDLEAVPLINEAMERVCAWHAPTSFLVRGFGCFPSARNPRIFWTGIESADLTLRGLQQDLEAELEKIGFKQERRAFKPHLTLARIRGPLPRWSLDELQQDLVLGEQDVGEIILFQSELKPTGAIYVPLAKVPLLGGGMGNGGK